MLSSTCGSPPALHHALPATKLILLCRPGRARRCCLVERLRFPRSSWTPLLSWGDQEIPKAELDRLLEQAKSNYEAQQQEFPKTGRPPTRTSRAPSSAVSCSRPSGSRRRDGNQGDRRGDRQAARGAQRQYFKGDDDKYKEELEKQGLTEEQLREQIKAKLLSDKIYAAATKKATVTEQEIKAYYDKNNAQYEQPGRARCATSCKKELADQIYAKLKNGADFAKLAKQYSEDTASAAEGGKFKAYKGEDGGAVRQVRLRRRHRGSLEADQDRVRLACDRGARGRQAPRRAAARRGAGLDQQHAPPGGAEQSAQAWVAQTKQKYGVAHAPGYAPAATTQGATTGATTTS